MTAEQIVILVYTFVSILLAVEAAVLEDKIRLILIPVWPIRYLVFIIKYFYRELTK